MRAGPSPLLGDQTGRSASQPSISRRGRGERASKRPTDGSPTDPQSTPISRFPSEQRTADEVANSSGQRYGADTC